MSGLAPKHRFFSNWPALWNQQPTHIRLSFASFIIVYDKIAAPEHLIFGSSLSLRVLISSRIDLARVFVVDLPQFRECHDHRHLQNITIALGLWQRRLPVWLY